ncbi:MAG: serine hydrolase domain-containing protein [Alphaproteobacteria bacterium]
MTLKHQTRRTVLKAASAAVAASSVAGVTGRSAMAADAKLASGAVAPIDAALREAVEAQTLPHVVAIGATDQGIVYEGAFGKRNEGGGPDVATDSVFWIASMTKAVTATACMQLVEQGKLSLDQTMGELLPELANPMVLEGFDDAGQPKLRPAARPITLRHLLTHTAGFVYSIWSEPMGRYEEVTGTPFIGSCDNDAFKAPLAFDPGDRWEYGINIDWVGKAVEAISDQSLEVYFRENIFQPLGMVDTGFLIGSEQRARTATMFSRGEDGTLASMPFEMPQRPEFFMGGGALFSTPRDYIAFLQMQLNDGSFNGAQVLKPETIATMRENHIGDLEVVTLKTANPELSNDANFFPGMSHKWGLSFDINTEEGPAGRSAGSLCWAGLFNTYFWIDPTRKVTGLIMTQLLPFADGPMLDVYAKFERGLYDALDKA